MMAKTGNIGRYQGMILERDMCMGRLNHLTAMNMTRNRTMTGTANRIDRRYHLTTMMAHLHQTTDVDLASIASMARLRPSRQVTSTSHTLHRLVRIDCSKAPNAHGMLTTAGRLPRNIMTTVLGPFQTRATQQSTIARSYRRIATTTDHTIPLNSAPRSDRRNAKFSSRSSLLNKKSAQATSTPTLPPTTCIFSTSMG